MLRPFATSHADSAKDIRTALTDGRREDAERAAHTLKGVAGTIGARQLHREAGDVEAAFRRGATPAEIGPLLDCAERTLVALIPAVWSALPPEAEVGPVKTTVDPLTLAATVERLEQLLLDEAVEAIDAFEAAAPILSAAFGARVDPIGTLTRRYRFEDALTALREVAGRPEKG